MDLVNKKALVIGIGMSGISACKLLCKKGADVTIADSSTLDKISFSLDEVEKLGVKIITGKNPDDLTGYDVVILSPSVPFALPFIQEAIGKGVLVIPEIELAYLLSKGTHIGITGTNGKTTTTNLVSKIFSRAKDGVFETGNIGKPVSDYADISNEKSYFITELSSYMLESIESYHVQTAILLNITEDHLLRHKTMENYKNAKMNILKNQTIDDNVILNLDDEYTKSMDRYTKAKAYFFTTTDNEEASMYIKNGIIYENITAKNEKFININEIKILGVHNLYNIMASSICAIINGIERDEIIGVVKEYLGVEHRIEYVKTIDDVTYYNDSKGTNVDASVCAIDAMVRPIVLIAGGDEKNVSFDDFVLSIKNKVKFCVFVGKTKEKLGKSCEEVGYNDFLIVNDYIEAVSMARSHAENGDCVLLSPACASFDMFKSFEQRGDYFKELVNQL